MTFATSTNNLTSARTAYQQARIRYEADPTHPLAIRAMGWALANLLKEVSGTPDASPARLLRGLEMISAFPMDPQDQRWRESILWSVNRFLLRTSPDQLSLADLAPLIGYARAFVDPEPSLVRSVWWKALLRHAAVGIDWLGLFDELGWEAGFRPEDREPEAYGEGKSSAPLVERLIQAVAQQLLLPLPLSDEQAQPWLDRLTVLSQQLPDARLLPYYHARLLLKLNRPEEAMRVFLPFARRKKRDFWVWSLLADLYSNRQPEQQLACYARALTLGTPESFLVKVRHRVAARLIDQNRWAEAKTEIERLVQTRQSEGWPIPAEVTRWINDDRYTQTSAVAPNWYSTAVIPAESLLWSDQPEEVVLVTAIDPSGAYCYVAINAQTTGSFPVGRFGLNPAVGDRLAIRYEMRARNDRPRLHVWTARPVSAPCTHLHTRSVSGPLRIRPTARIGFVGDVYVPTDVLAGQLNRADQSVTVEAVKSWDATKKKMGWRAYRMTPVL